MIVVLEGKVGSGKTLAAVALATLENQKSGKRILSNIRLNEIPYQLFDTNDLLRMMSNSDELSDCSIILDDGYMYVDSRSSQTKLNRLFSYLIMQSRMRGVDIYITTDSMSFLDKRVRMSCDIKGLCKYNRDRHICSVILLDLRNGTKKRISFNANDFFSYIQNEERVMNENPIERITENINYRLLD